MSATWTPVGTDGAWLVSASDPPLMVKVAPWKCDDDQRSLGDAPDQLAIVLVELLAHVATDERIGALVRHVLGPPLDAAREAGTWKWSRRVSTVRPKEDSLWK